LSSVESLAVAEPEFVEVEVPVVDDTDDLEE
jgi:hypothetical protein